MLALWPPRNVLSNLLGLLRNAHACLRKSPDYVWLDVSGSLPEFERRAGFLRRRFSPGPIPPSLERLRERLVRAARDGRTRGVVLRIRNLDAGWASLEELRSELEHFREGGGEIVAYLVEADVRSYYLACAADRMLAPPLTTVGPLGVRVRMNFLKGALAKLGVEAEVVAVSPYKTAGDTFVREDLSPEAREQVERLLDARYETLLEAVSRGRKVSLDEGRKLVDGGPYPASRAVEAGLLDGVCYEDQLPGMLGGEGDRATVAEWSVAAKALRRPYRRSGRGGIGVVGLYGAISRGRSRRLPVPLPFFGGERAGDESVVAALRAAEKSRKIRAVLFHVESPGGDALASDLIWREVQRIREKKPVVVLMGNTAASGGYYVSAGASRIVARRGTLTGSIGVLIVRPVAAGLLRNLGVSPVAVERGGRTGLFDPSRSPSADERAAIHSQVEAAYAEFKDRVIRGRTVEMSELEPLAGGRVWTGEEAVGRGLVDGAGGFREAVTAAAELAGIDGDPLEALVKVRAPGGRLPPGDPAGDLDAGIRTLLSGAPLALAPFEVSDV
jgi:protease-4